MPPSESTVCQQVQAIVSSLINKTFQIWIRPSTWKNYLKLGPKNCKLACEVKKGKHKLLTCMTCLGPKNCKLACKSKILRASTNCGHAWHNPDNWWQRRNVNGRPCLFEWSSSSWQELPGILWLVQDRSLLSVPLISFGPPEIDNKKKSCVKTFNCLRTSYFSRSK